MSDEWAIITRCSVPSATRFVREITTFLRLADGAQGGNWGVGGETGTTGLASQTG